MITITEAAQTHLATKKTALTFVYSSLIQALQMQSVAYHIVHLKQLKALILYYHSAVLMH